MTPNQWLLLLIAGGAGWWLYRSLPSTLQSNRAVEEIDVPVVKKKVVPVEIMDVPGAPASPELVTLYEDTLTPDVFRTPTISPYIARMP